MKSFLRNGLIGIAAALAAGLLTVALPLLKAFLSPDHGDHKPRIVAQVHVTSMEPPKPEIKPRRTLHEPAHAKPSPTLLKAGPRFAMDLGVAGSGGAAAPLDIVNKRRGGGGASEGDGGVDEKPQPSFPPPFRMPQEVKTREQDAYLLLSFCVDVSGRPYDIQIVEERPPGLGMGAAGKEALQQTRFSPARKGAASVPFCGLEQPFEIRFSN